MNPWGGDLSEEVILDSLELNRLSWYSLVFWKESKSLTPEYFCPLMKPLFCL